MHANQILKIYGTDYQKMTIALLRKAALASRIPGKDARIGIKPNLVSPTPADFGATTHPEIIAGIIEYLHAEGFDNIVMLESSWVGDRTEEAIDICGYQRILEAYKVPFIDTKKDGSFREDCAGMPLKICQSVLNIDFLINVPVLKGHCQTRMTCALKNMKGLIPDSEKRRFHSLGLHKPIAHLNTAIRQDFIVIDHICGDPDCEDGGNPVVTNCIMTAIDPVLADAYACQTLGYDVSDVPYVGLAEQLGVGKTDLSHADIRLLVPRQTAEKASDPLRAKAVNETKADPWILIPEAAAHQTAEVIPLTRKYVSVSEMIDEVESCSACYASLVPALFRLQEEGLLEKLTERFGKICIGQGFRNQAGQVEKASQAGPANQDERAEKINQSALNGKIGIGNCTAQFAHTVPGCPPDEDTIYMFLKKLAN